VTQARIRVSSMDVLMTARDIRIAWMDMKVCGMVEVEWQGAGVS
jgi:hypothetical protein